MSQTASAAPIDGVVTFADGLPGFERCRQFVLLASPALQPFAVLQGVDADAPAFVTIDPRLVADTFPTTLDRVTLARLGARDDEPLLWLAIITAGDDGAATANLRAPLVINPASMRGVQLISLDSPYRIDHPLQAA
ncbi:MAG TPA: flagellar assembly protein FliW [Vicinamibacterales bacterium]|jgi:flagellar assembly factor FliW|nr:flagellar assembly protein FliW [Vicinamibacterales bacterium]